MFFDDLSLIIKIKLWFSIVTLHNQRVMLLMPLVSSNIAGWKPVGFIVGKIIELLLVDIPARYEIQCQRVYPIVSHNIPHEFLVIHGYTHVISLCFISRSHLDIYIYNMVKHIYNYVYIYATYQTYHGIWISIYTIYIYIHTIYCHFCNFVASLSQRFTTLAHEECL
jgi:hypothetical protein